MDFTTIILVLDSALRLATPLLFACLAGLFSERSGIFDIGLEGKMLASAFFSASVAAFTGSAWLGLLAGMGASIFLALIHGVASITFRGNQLISGVAINFLASGVTVIVGQSWFHLGGRTPQLEGAARFQEITLPFAEALRGVPVIGPIYADLISGHSILVYAGFAAVALSWWVLYRTRFGLRLRAVGENPEAVDTAGISVIGLRYTATVICGALCGLAGTYLSTGLAAGFVREMSAGRGFIALAALIFAKWRPGYALLACLLFGLLEAMGNRFQNIDILGINVPTQFMQALPYILTVVILAGFVGRAIPPRAGGEPYVKER
ncbi:MAG: ABC transporter permease [Alphaproteobacteria bacterium]|nr:MAG: ABC transporter permease [Alphaproteobacteria bacterium]